MLNLKIDDPELENSLRQAYGNNDQSIIDAFRQFVQLQKIKRDVAISKEQIKNGEVLDLDKVIDDICAKYK